MYLPGDIATGTSRVFNIDPPRFDPAARQGEIDLVIQIATAAIPEVQMRKFGRLSLAPARDDDDHAYFAQIRSEPIGASGTEFRFPMSARETGRRNLPATAAQLVESAVLFVNNAGKFGEVVKIVRAIADAALKPATGGIAGMSLIGIGITPNQLDEMVEVTVDVEMLGDDLTMGIERVTGYVTDIRFNWMSRKLYGLAAKHVARRALLARAKVAGISGWIDDSALRILDRASFDRADAISMLRAARQVDFSFGGVDGNDIKGGLYWDDGIVRGYVESRARGNVYRLQAKVLTVKVQMLPATVAAGLIGRHLGEAIAFDYIPGNALIIGVQQTSDWLYLELEIGLSSIEQVIEA